MRDVEKGVNLYFYDISSGIFTGEIGTAGDSDGFALPPGMTPVAPDPLPLENEKATFNESAQTWEISYKDPYDGLTQEEKDQFDLDRLKKIAIDEAQNKIIGRATEAVDKILMVMIRERAALNLSTGEVSWAEDVRNDYANWQDLI